MAPCSTSYSTLHHIRISERDNIKLRKPVVEKMRRDRINSCIEQLKVILEKEFHKQEPNSKLEKADILEMTVSFLRQQLQSGLWLADFTQADSHCWGDSVHFLPSAEPSVTPPPPPGSLLQDQKLQQARRACISSLRPRAPQDCRGPVWRPW